MERACFGLLVAVLGLCAREIGSGGVVRNRRK